MSRGKRHRGPTFKKSRKLTLCVYENIHLAFAEKIAQRGRHRVVPVRSGTLDEDLVGSASGVLVTHDPDFDDVRQFPPGKHNGIVVIAISSRRLEALVEVFRRFLASGRASDAVGNIVILHESDFLIRSSRGTELCKYKGK